MTFQATSYIFDSSTFDTNIALIYWSQAQEYGGIYTFVVYIGSISIPFGQAERETPVNISTQPSRKRIGLSCLLLFSVLVYVLLLMIIVFV